jgi:ribonucleoside-diphosphate reductase alpha chain
MGWSDMLYELNIPYDSEDAIQLAEKIMSFISKTAREESESLGKLRGSFSNFKGSLWQKRGFKYMRNATVTTIAPNGTTSLLADCNGGIEPFFALGYVRKNMETMENTELIYINKILEKRLKSEWLFEEKLMKEIVKKGSIQNISKLPSKIKKVFVTAMDISPLWHLRMQAAFQKYTDNAVSKTINFREDSTVEDIKKAFEIACDLKLKGMTIYRDKSRNMQVLNI